MDNIRLFLWVAFLAMVWVTYTVWVTDYAPPPTAPPATSVPEEAAPARPDDGLPPLAEPGATESGSPAAGAGGAPRRSVHVVTDVLDVLIDLEGGDLVRVDLPQYPVEKHRPDVPVRLLDYEPATRWVYRTGLRTADEGADPDHTAVFSSAASEYRLADGQDELTVALDWTRPDGVTARKVYTFRRGEYRIDLALELLNGTGAPLRSDGYAQMLRRHNPPERSFMSVDSYSFTGPVLYDGDQYHKLQVEDLVRQPVTQTVTGGWMAAIQHHFLGAIVPPPELEMRYQATARDDQFVLSTVAPAQEVAPGGRLELPLRLFVGPKLQSQLAATANELELTVDYGVLTILAQPLFWMLSQIERFVGNWGWAIVIATFIIKLAFYKLTAASGRSMAKMRKLAPRMKALQERYKDDRQALGQAMMELYKREKVNPAAGCLPILVQMPFFFAYYWVLVESVEMRQAPFVLWIDDLSSRDPYFVLPLLMGAAMFFQTRLNPAPPDPVQARVMQIMPIVFTVFFAFFPSGLVLYWLTNTVLSILQQWRINTIVAREG
ncbi:MAG TPA: membrane protein insertase YidC [Gammaproteobacteria bacterium]